MRQTIFFLAIVTVGICFTPNTSRAQAFECPTYSASRAAGIVRQVYLKVLERDADDSGLITFSGKLSGGGWCVQQVVQELGVSAEYANRFIKNQTPRQAVTLMYRHFLLREPENKQVVDQHVNDMNGKGWQAKVLDFVKSPEASKTWGAIRGARPKTTESGDADSSLLASGCKYFLGRKGNYLCTTQKGYDLCESKRPDPKNAVSACQLAGVNPEADKSLVGQGCSRNAVGEYTCLAQKAFDACEAFKSTNKVKVCRRTAIKIGGNK